MTKHALLSLLLQLVNAAMSLGPNKYGNPVSYLLEQVFLYQDALLEDILNSTPIDSHELRLNGAGLKLYWSHSKGKFRFNVGGDQRDLYPMFVEMAQKIITDRGYTRSYTAWRDVSDKPAIRFTTIA